MLKRRINKYLEYKDITTVDFFKSTGIKRGFLDSDKLERSVSDTSLQLIYEAYPDINMVWLVTGDGEMTTSNTADRNDYTIGVQSKKNNNKLIKHLEQTIEAQMKQINNLNTQITQQNDIIAKLIEK